MRIILFLLCFGLQSGVQSAFTPFQKHPERKVVPRSTSPKPPVKPPSHQSFKPVVPDRVRRPPIPESHDNAIYYPPSHNFSPPGKASLKGKVWSEWVDLPNPQINQWHLMLRNVSYKEGVLSIHLPEGSSRSTAGLKSHIKVQIVNTPLDLASCTTVERRSVTYAFLGHSLNPYITNFGHLLINVVNPLFRYLFFVRNQLHNLTDDRLIPDHQLPLANTLLLLNIATNLPKSPGFLFDVVLRFASSYIGDHAYFQTIDPGSTRCFDSIAVPLYDLVDPVHPGVPPKQKSYGIWDTMHFSHKGRWGKGDFYYNFWRSVKKQIWQLYDIPTADYGMDAGNLSSITMGKPQLGFTARSGAGSYRFDGNAKEVVDVLSKDFDVTKFDGGFYHWHAKDESLRYKVARSTLLKVKSMDIMIGQSGSNNQLALFMKEGRILVEIKNYAYCNNEAGKAVANHNRLSFYTLKVTDVAALGGKNSPVQYKANLLSKLSREMLSAWNFTVRARDSDTNKDTWPSTCDFLWPHQDSAILSKSAIMTRNNVSRCYLEQVPGKGWYQLAKHKNSLLSRCGDRSVPHGTVVIYCMISGLC